MEERCKELNFWRKHRSPQLRCAALVMMTSSLLIHHKWKCPTATSHYQLISTEFHFFLSFSSHLRQMYKYICMHSFQLQLLKIDSNIFIGKWIRNKMKCNDIQCEHMSLSQTDTSTCTVHTSTRLSPHRACDGHCVLAFVHIFTIHCRIDSSV